MNSCAKCPTAAHPGDVRKGSCVSLLHRTKRDKAVCWSLSRRDAELLVEASTLSLTSVAQTQPHPNAGCILADKEGRVVGSGSLWAQGAQPPEVAAVLEAQGLAKDGTAYLNLETGDCHGDDAAIRALIQSGIQRCVIGMRHPLLHLRGKAVAALRSAGVQVDVLGDDARVYDSIQDMKNDLDIVFYSNEALLHRSALGRPMGVLKYAMTMDGKIAASSGHSAWVSSKESRNIVFETRASCNAVIVGGQTVRRDNPKLTTRRDSGHQPVRIVMSRKLDLPIEAAMWDTTVAPTIVATQRGARKEMQEMLVKKGVEVVEFDFLTPDAVSDYCYQRGFMSCLWECGGALAAPAVSDNAIHKVVAFIAPKLIGGERAPTPMGDLGFVEMTQAIQVAEPTWSQVGPDLMMTGYLPTSGGPKSLAAALGLLRMDAQFHSTVSSSSGNGPQKWLSKNSSPVEVDREKQLEFYKCWDKLGFLSNFSPHDIDMPQGTMDEARFDTIRASLISAARGALPGTSQTWRSVEHYYQAQKFEGMDGAEEIIQNIMDAASPEEAAHLGRTAERMTPYLVRQDWPTAKRSAMHAAILRKFSRHDVIREQLLATSSSSDVNLVEASPHDFFWGGGVDGSGENHLGMILMSVREELAKVYVYYEQ